uniref:Methylmalonic aciduria and homocystinuria type D homolog, mitochondrial-like n=1 Tax=Phallusia mammillata TaxID=59560 RepID=A0A6F9DKA1_9ASCI|nr:methylmalonic aciduria and homocystinuria type D homolog, mitochondrial-like [Phallusia mammillata]
MESEEVLEGTNRCDRQLAVVSQLISESDFLDENEKTSVESGDVTETIILKYFEGATVELAIQDCPKVLQRDITSMFMNMPKKKITVITITQKTQNDMSAWNQHVEEERDKLLQNFITTATEICHLLRANSIWCDFIDPSSGQPFFSQYTNHTLFETDDRYNHLGFRIEDLGCCKVITHKKWGSHIFVGSIFTDVNKQHPVLKKLLLNSKV